MKKICAPPSPDEGFLTSRISNFPVRSICSVSLGKQNDLSSSAGSLQSLEDGVSCISGRAVRAAHAESPRRRASMKTKPRERTMHLVRGLPGRLGPRHQVYAAPILRDRRAPRMIELGLDTFGDVTVGE